MKHYLILISFLVSIFLTGCSIKHPQSPGEFREAVSAGAFMTKVDTYEVDRSLSAVAGAFKKKASKCLDITITTTSQSSRSYQVIVRDYKSTVVAGKDKVELHLQQHYAKGVKIVSEEPPGGFYLIVADATPLAKKKTLIKVYGPSMGYDVIKKAIKGWATGKNMGCPDLTK